MPRSWLVALAVLPLQSLPSRTEAQANSAPVQSAPTYGVYLRLVEAVKDQSFENVLQGVRRGIQSSGWVVVADYAPAVAASCSFRAHVFVVHSPTYAKQVLHHGLQAAFALPLRLAVYQDEGGTHVTAANPQSLNRTIIAESGIEALTDTAVAALRQMVAGEFPQHLAERQHGQMRDRGLIGKTMGIIAGGPFKDKLEKAVALRATSDSGLAEVASRAYQGLERTSDQGKWEIRPIYRLDLSEQGVVIIGVTGAKIEARSFQIVHQGDDEARKSLACPGIDHAAAFPIEIVMTREADEIKALIVDEMFRMKVYFEDAGKMKFATNMQMPGSIESEIRDKLEESLF